MPVVHRSLAAHLHTVPKPFASFAVRSDEPGHAGQARAPYGRVHVVQTTGLDAASLARLAADGFARVCIDTPGDVDHAATTHAELAGLAPRLADLAGSIAQAVQRTGVLGAGPAGDHGSVDARIDYLASRGAGFHNDVSGHWSRCLFWVLALDVGDVEFVMPHAGVRLPLAAGDLLVFDQTMAHGLCRPADQGQMLEASFTTGKHDRQLFLTGELLLSDAQWAALGVPWLPVEQHAQRGALDLLVATFDERSGGIQRLQALRGCMLRSVCNGVDSAA